MHANVSPTRHVLNGLLLSLVSTTTLCAQARTSNPPASNTPDAQIVTTTIPDARDETAPATPHDAKAAAAQRADAAWTMLNDAVTDAKHPDLRVQALAALGTMGTNPRSSGLILTAMADTDVDVRTAAVLAAGQTGNRNLTNNLRSMLDDKEPQVAFAAATTLWKMRDPSGENILIAVVDGERRARDTPVSGAMRTAHKDLHSPGTLAHLGALQGASMLLGPFGFGITAYEYMRKNGGNSARVAAIEQLSQSSTNPIHTTLIQATTDKDPAVRAAAAKAIGHYHEPAADDALYAAFDDSKAPVRLTAAAAYINSTTPSSTGKTSRRRLK
ncbi:HEAT repeat domain-containing protein [Edaphobacter bradus]|uniref:HEAT repeat domain-containing protein n=1 Tax=Edaphobacter bradus TaxID=2259016 RepID=UPI0021DFDCC9|nr:HEAT repeat domain-containing protein [Edaphobacter bradus]